RSRRPPDALHAFGHGKDLYFYTLLVAVLIFGLGGGVSIYEGILHVLHPRVIRDVTLSYIVIGISAVFEATSWTLGLRSYKSAKPPGGFWASIKRSKDPTTFAVLLEDSAALAGLLAAFLGIYGSRALHAPVLDGVASIMIGSILCVVAVVLLRESKGLLIGETADPRVVLRIRQLVAADEAVQSVGRLLTMQ